MLEPHDIGSLRRFAERCTLLVSLTYGEIVTLIHIWMHCQEGLAIRNNQNPQTIKPTALETHSLKILHTGEKVIDLYSLRFCHGLAQDVVVKISERHRRHN
jgi:hypothetical protein